MKARLRRPISKATRQMVYDKFGGHCAYCGKKIEYKDMQVDHIIAIAKHSYGTIQEMEKVAAMIKNNSINDIDNLMPACQ